jgi:hypothetical protein
MKKLRLAFESNMHTHGLVALALVALTIAPGVRGGHADEHPKCTNGTAIMDPTIGGELIIQ